MIGDARKWLRWLAAHPWLMAWVAFAKGVVLGMVISAAVHRRRAGQQEGVAHAAADRQVEQEATHAAWSPSA